ncbi:glycosyltransferase [Hafnia paralvei]|uniref:glycosyltransferase n=1 Tax=Hafnia paralvei TaxID=546367 RepID=UPI001033A882|nr:glycosyltransferase [Hafnia paralvei]TBL63629.1 glycosyltransferase [Hafnia paralvei]
MKIIIINVRDIREENMEKHHSHLTITAAVIVKNEERCIARCIDSLSPVFDEIIVIDTGSQDATLAILGEPQYCQAVTLFQMTWDDDFSKPRNLAIDKAQGHYIFFIDADECIISSKDEVLNEFYKIDALTYKHKIALRPTIKDHNGNESKSVRRAFINNGKFYFFGVVHEELRLTDNTPPFDAHINVTLSHDGYRSDVIAAKNKKVRNNMLNEKNLVLEPNNLRWAYFYARDKLESNCLNEIYVFLENKIKVDKDIRITRDNIREDNYTFSILDIMVQAKLRLMVFDSDFESLIELMNEFIPYNSNGIYYTLVSDIFRWKVNVRHRVKEIIEYKKDVRIVNNDMLHSGGLHLDSILAIYLYEMGMAQQAEKLLISVKSSGFQTELSENYLNTMLNK